MKLKMRGETHRFKHPSVLRGDAPFLGATVRQWDNAIVGNMELNLFEIKRLAELSPKRDVNTAKTFDLASYVGRNLAKRK